MALLESLGFAPLKFVWQIVNFLILLFILNKLLYKPMLQMLDDRKKSIEDAINSAETAKAEAEALRKEYETRLAEAKKEAQDIIAKATKLGEEMKKKLLPMPRKKLIRRFVKHRRRLRGKRMLLLRPCVTRWQL